jgi:hypothetical protein
MSVNKKAQACKSKPVKRETNYANLFALQLEPELTSISGKQICANCHTQLQTSNKKNKRKI